MICNNSAVCILILAGCENHLCCTCHTNKKTYSIIPLLCAIESPVAQCVARRAPMQQCV